MTIDVSGEGDPHYVHADESDALAVEMEEKATPEEAQRNERSAKALSGYLRAPWRRMDMGIAEALLHEYARAESAESEVVALKKKVESLEVLYYAPTGDNHHNAALCPYCRPSLEEERKERVALTTRVEGLVTAGEQVAVALESACSYLGEKTPRKTVPVLAAWGAAKEKP